MNQFPILTDLDNGYALSLNAESFNGLKVQTYRKSAGWNVAAYQGKDAWILPVPATFVAGRDSIIRLLIPIQSPWRPDARACQNNATALISRSRHATYESVSPLLPTRIPVPTWVGEECFNCERQLDVEDDADSWPSCRCILCIRSSSTGLEFAFFASCQVSSTMSGLGSIAADPFRANIIPRQECPGSGRDSVARRMPQILIGRYRRRRRKIPKLFHFAPAILRRVFARCLPAFG
jgi:hypothetical protein